MKKNLNSTYFRGICILVKNELMSNVLKTYTKEELLKKYKSQRNVAIIQGFVIFLMVL